MGTLLVDPFAIYFFYLFLAGAAIAVLMSMRYLEIEQENHGEFYALMLFSVVGMMCMAAGYRHRAAIHRPGADGHLDLRAGRLPAPRQALQRSRAEVSAAGRILLRHLRLRPVAVLWTDRQQPIWTKSRRACSKIVATRPNDPVVIFALLATATGLLFKIAAVPFHQWAPDAYEGAPTSITGFMSVAVKAAGWAMLLRIFLFALYPLRSMYVPLLIFVSIATMTGGNLAAITQTNLKRLLAYSSIAHVGYMLLGLVASDGQTNSPPASWRS